MKLFIVDAFTSELFGGNAAGVVLIPDGGDFPQDEMMRKVAAELRYSETAFVKTLGDNAFRTRYFTPAAEVDLCGHATIAAFHVLRELGVARDGVCANSTLAGELNVEVKGGEVWMDMAAPERIATIAEPENVRELYSVMGLDAAISRNAPQREDGTALHPEIISTGLPDIILPVATKEGLDAIAPDFAALAELSERYGVTGVHAFCAPSVLFPSKDAPTYRCRNFAPLYGIDEEAATGTANGALTYYLYRRGLLTPGATNTFVQGEAMGRPSRIMTRLSIDSADSPANSPVPNPAAETDMNRPLPKLSPAITIQVGGRAITLVTGEIDLGFA